MVFILRSDLPCHTYMLYQMGFVYCYTPTFRSHVLSFMLLNTYYLRLYLYLYLLLST